MEGMLFGMLCTLCCRGEMVLDEETGRLVCTYFEKGRDGSLVWCGHMLTDNKGIRMLLAANALACSGKDDVPAYATRPTDRKPVLPEPTRRVRHLGVYEGARCGHARCCAVRYGFVETRRGAR